MTLEERNHLHSEGRAPRVPDSISRPPGSVGPATKAICKSCLSQRPFNGEIGKTYSLKCSGCKRITNHVVRAADFKVQAFTGQTKAESHGRVQTLPSESSSLRARLAADPGLEGKILDSVFAPLHKRAFFMSPTKSQITLTYGNDNTLTFEAENVRFDPVSQWDAIRPIVTPIEYDVILSSTPRDVVIDVEAEVIREPKLLKDIP